MIAEYCAPEFSVPHYVRGRSDLTATPADLRGWSGDCTDVANRIKDQIDPAEDACSQVKDTLEDWEIANGVTALHQRWEALNELLS